MAEEATQQAAAAASRQAELADALSQHLCKVLESTMAEAVQALAIQVAVLAVHKAKQLKDIAGKQAGGSHMSDSSRSSGVKLCALSACIHRGCQARHGPEGAT